VERLKIARLSPLARRQDEIADDVKGSRALGRATAVDQFLRERKRVLRTREIPDPRQPTLVQ